MVEKKKKAVIPNFYTCTYFMFYFVSTIKTLHLVHRVGPTTANVHVERGIERWDLISVRIGAAWGLVRHIWPVS